MNLVLPGLLLVIIALSACDGPERESDTATGLTVADVLGGGDTAGFERAVEPRDFRFPRDHAAHPAFRSEWWYITGNLEDNRGRRYGYQVTFFRNALAPPDQAPANPSAWTTRQVWMAHAAVTDIDGRQHEAVERFSRGEPGLAGARLDPPRVWLHDWRLTGDGDAFPARLEVAGEAFSLQLTLATEKPPVLHGDAGLSRKGREPGNASYYYSYTRLKTRGRLRFGDNTVPVTGASWLDREWSTSALGALARAVPAQNVVLPAEGAP
jgi:predicted secreted hydrolase